MDTGINMLGQFQGDSSLGLGSFQGNSYPSLEISSLEDRSLSNPFEQDAKISEQGLRVEKSGWYYEYDSPDYNVEYQKQVERTIANLMKGAEIVKDKTPTLEDFKWKKRVDFATKTSVRESKLREGLFLAGSTASSKRKFKLTNKGLRSCRGPDYLWIWCLLFLNDLKLCNLLKINIFKI